MKKLFLSFIIFIFCSTNIFAMRLTFDQNFYAENKAHQLNYNRVQDRQDWVAQEFLDVLSSIPWTPEYHYMTFGINEGINPYLELENVDVILTPENLGIITNINSEANYNITFVPDDYDFWGFPRSKTGDCDNYAITKQYHLLTGDRSDYDFLPFIPVATLGIKSYLMLCVTETGEGHCVLCVHTSHGDYILDNRTQEVLSIDDDFYAGYTWEGPIECPGGIWRLVLGVEDGRFVLGNETWTPNMYRYWRDREFAGIINWDM